MSGDLDRPGRAAGLQPLAELAMQLAAAQPGHVAVERVADQRVAEGAAALAALGDEPALEQLADAGLAGQLDDRLEREADARRRPPPRPRRGPRA